MKKINILFIFLFLGVVFSFAQGGTPQQDAAREQAFRDSKQRAEDENYPRTQRVFVLKDKQSLAEADKLKLAPPAEDLAKYEQFLNNKKAGIVKLTQFYDCDRRVININNDRCLNAPNTPGNGALYSLTERSYFDLHDISLKREFLIAGGSLGLITNLGDVSLENIESSNEAKQLKKFKISQERSDWKPQFDNFFKGIEIGGKQFKNHSDIKLNNTYLLRSVKSKNFAFVDTTFAFRVIRKDADGSVVLIWKKI